MPFNCWYYFNFHAIGFSAAAGLLSLKILYLLLMFLRGLSGFKSSEVSAFLCFWADFAGV